MTNDLEIIKHVLRTQGKRTIISLAQPSGDVPQIQDALASASRDFQTRGWWFNTERKFTILPDSSSGEIKVPVNTVKFRQYSGYLNWQDTHIKQRYVLRGVRVYDTEKHTYNIGCPLAVDIAIELPVNELPQSAANYLKHKLAEDFNIDDDGDPTKTRDLKERRQYAWAQLISEEMSAMATNALQSPQANALRYRIGQYGSPSNPYFPGGVPR